VQYAAVCHYRPFAYVSGVPKWAKPCHRIWFNKLCKIRQVKTVKIVDAQQARLYNSYKNTKCKLLKTNAEI